MAQEEEDKGNLRSAPSSSLSPSSLSPRRDWVGLVGVQSMMPHSCLSVKPPQGEVRYVDLGRWTAQWRPAPEGDITLSRGTKSQSSGHLAHPAYCRLLPLFSQFPMTYTLEHPFHPCSSLCKWEDGQQAVLTTSEDGRAGDTGPQQPGQEMGGASACHIC